MNIEDLKRDDEQAKEFLKKTYATKVSDAKLEKELQKPMDEILKGVQNRNEAARKRKNKKAVEELKKSSTTTLDCLDD